MIIDSDSLERAEQAIKLLKVFGNDDESPYLLMGAGTPEECEQGLRELLSPSVEKSLSA